MSREGLEELLRRAEVEPELDAILREPGDALAFAEVAETEGGRRGLSVTRADVLDAVAERRRAWLSTWP